MEVRKRIRTTIEFAIEEDYAQRLCADLLFLFDATKDIEGIVPARQSQQAAECRRRLGELQKRLQEAL